MDLDQYVQDRLDAIQKKHHFDPEDGAGQVRGRAMIDYGAFRELVRLARKLQLDIDITTPFGATKAERIDWAYVAQIVGTNIWKFGHSVDPVGRVRELQVGNHLDLTLRYSLQGGHAVEQELLRYFRKFKTRNSNRFGSEWREVEAKLIHQTARRIKREGPDFLKEPLPKPKRV